MIKRPFIAKRQNIIINNIFDLWLNQSFKNLHCQSFFTIIICWQQQQCEYVKQSIAKNFIKKQKKIHVWLDFQQYTFAQLSCNNIHLFVKVFIPNVFLKTLEERINNCSQCSKLSLFLSTLKFSRLNGKRKRQENLHAHLK